MYLKAQAEAGNSKKLCSSSSTQVVNVCNVCTSYEVVIKF